MTLGKLTLAIRQYVLWRPLAKALKVIVLILVLVVGLGLAPASVDFKREQLSLKGQTAYDRLFSACVFRIGPVGYGAEIPKEEFALYDLLEEEHAVEALKSLVATASYEGGLYGLVGLSLKDNSEFNRGVELFKARRERPARPETTKGIECRVTDAGEYVTTQSGCIISAQLRAKVITEIQSGRYDRFISAKYRPRQ